MTRMAPYLGLKSAFPDIENHFNFSLSLKTIFFRQRDENGAASLLFSCLGGKESSSSAAAKHSSSDENATAEEQRRGGPSFFTFSSVLNSVSLSAVYSVFNTYLGVVFIFTMVCLKDFADITLPVGSSRFDYLLAVCGVDLNQSLITPSLPDKEEWKKKLMGSFYGCLSWHNNVVVKPVVQSTALTNTPESVISHSSGDGRASLKYDEAVAEKVNNSKKRKRGSSRVPNNGPEPPPGLPVEFRNFILQLAGNRAVRVEKLVIQKKLTNTDVKSTQNRLSIPARLVREEFLTEEERLLLCQHNGKNVCSIEVPLITPMMEVAKVSLRRWEMKKERGHSSVSYVIANTWNEIRRRNKFESDMIVQLWAIRVDIDLWMTLVRLS
nr:B3 domain-containing protein At5g24050-like [Ipomoea batatas]GME16098.1 B3 domain-containing protein At5g24050-like [Ipomoea batatas]